MRPLSAEAVSAPTASVGLVSADHPVSAQFAPEPADQGQLRRFSAIEKRLPVELGYAANSYAIDGHDHIPPEIEALTSLGNPRHYRVDFSKGWASGHSELCGLTDGLIVQLSYTTYVAPCAMSVSAPDMLRVRIASDGDYEYATVDGARISIRGAGVSIIIEPPGRPSAQAAFGGRNHGASIVVHRNMLKRLFAPGIEELPSEVRAFITGDLRHSVARRLPLERSLLRCLEDLDACELEGHNRRLFIRSKAIEILCRAFDAMAREDISGSPEDSTLTARSVFKARQLLNEHFVTPPSLEDLAQQVGLCRSKLCDSFRQIVGQTVYDYVADRRMEHALMLLQRRDRSITQIAYAVGYSHPSSFSMAIQRRFGVSPSVLRRRALPHA